MCFIFVDLSGQLGREWTWEWAAPLMPMGFWTCVDNLDMSGRGVFRSGHLSPAPQVHVVHAVHSSPPPPTAALARRVFWTCVDNMDVNGRGGFRSGHPSPAPQVHVVHAVHPSPLAAHRRAHAANLVSSRGSGGHDIRAAR